MIPTHQAVSGIALQARPLSAQLARRQKSLQSQGLVSTFQNALILFQFFHQLGISKISGNNCDDALQLLEEQLHRLEGGWGRWMVVAVARIYLTNQNLFVIRLRQVLSDILLISNLLRSCRLPAY